MLAAQGPVGTRGGVEWMRRPCACPRWGATCLLHAVPTGSRCHQAPTLPHIRPLSLQDPIRLSTFIRIGADTLPVLVVNIHQGDRSNGQGLFFTLNLALTFKCAHAARNVVVPLAGTRLPALQILSAVICYCALSALAGCSALPIKT